MIVLIACLPGSPKTFNPIAKEKALQSLFPSIVSKVFTPSDVCSFLESDSSFDSLRESVRVLESTRSELTESVREEVLSVFAEMLREPYDVLFIEGFARSPRDVTRWKDFFAGRTDLFVIFENLSENGKLLTLEIDGFQEMISACIQAGGTYFPDDHDGFDRLIKTILSKRLEELVPIES